MAHQLLWHLLNEIQQAEWYSVIADETRDASGAEQLRISLWWVDSDYTVYEDLIGLVEVEMTDAATLVGISRTPLSECLCSLPSDPMESSVEQGVWICYLAHHTVIRCDKETTRLQTVYDVSVKSTGLSLNECLHAGPKFDPTIYHLLLRFRIHRVANTADINKAFLIVCMVQQNWDVHQFLWVNNITNKQPELVPLHFTRVVFGVLSSPFLLNATNRHHLESQLATQPYLREELQRTLYMDEIITGASDEIMLMCCTRPSRMFSRRVGSIWGSFVPIPGCCSWGLTSKRSQASKQLQLQDHRRWRRHVSATLNSSHEHHFGERKVLGVQWDIPIDHFVMSPDDITSAAAKLQTTIRTIMSLVGRFLILLASSHQLWSNLRLFSRSCVKQG